MFTQKDLDNQIKLGNLQVQKHPTKDLYIYNYTRACMFSGNWNTITMACRGLILDGDRNIVARPFKKFKNIEEYKPEELPVCVGFDVFDKLDGSIIFITHYQDEILIASRGSFTSDQCMGATKIYEEKYKYVTFKPGYTYCLEYIAPDNRIVVDYGDTRDLILLAIIDNATGKDVALEDIGIPLVKKYDGITDYHKLKNLAEKNKEGFVVKFENGLRIKVKFEEYVRLHSILTQISNKSIWEAIRKGNDIKEIIELAPDEMYAWVAKTRDTLIAQFREIEREAFDEFRNIKDRKLFSEYARNCKHTDVLYRMYDGLDHKEIIWKMIKPQFRKGLNDMVLPEEEI